MTTKGVGMRACVKGGAKWTRSAYDRRMVHQSDGDGVRGVGVGPAVGVGASAHRSVQCESLARAEREGERMRPRGAGGRRAETWKRHSWSAEG